MARGANAKQVVIEKIREAFGADFVGVSDGKVYVSADDGGEKVQIAIGLTCPKVPYNPNDEGLDFSTMSSTPVTAPAFEPAQVSEKELDNIRNLIAEFGL